MIATLECPACGKGLKVNLERAKDQITCDGCGNPVPVPAKPKPRPKSEPALRSPAKSGTQKVVGGQTISTNCGQCGMRFKVAVRFAGKRIKCKQCGAVIAVPKESKPRAPSSRATVELSSGTIAALSLMDEPTRQVPEDLETIPLKSKPRVSERTPDLAPPASSGPPAASPKSASTRPSSAVAVAGLGALLVVVLLVLLKGQFSRSPVTARDAAQTTPETESSQTTGESEAVTIRLPDRDDRPFTVTPAATPEDAENAPATSAEPLAVNNSDSPRVGQMEQGPLGDVAPGPPDQALGVPSPEPATGVAHREGPDTAALPSRPTTARWDAAADPPLGRWRYSPPPRLSVPMPSAFPNILFPCTPSQYAAVGSNRGPQDSLEIWDLRLDKRTGRIGGPKNWNHDRRALSADGRHLAVVANDPRVAEIWSVRTGKGLWRLDLYPVQAGRVLFAGPNHLLVAEEHGQHVQIWAIETGKRQGAIQLPGPFDCQGIASTPGGKYLAVLTNNDTLRLYATASGEQVALRAIPKARGNAGTVGMAFSGDGEQLAIAFDGESAGRIVAVAMADGSITHDHGFPEPLANIFSNPQYQGLKLQWLADKSGWLLYGNGIVNYADGGVRVRFQRDPVGRFPRFMADAENVIGLVQGRNARLFLQAVPVRERAIGSAFQ